MSIDIKNHTDEGNNDSPTHETIVIINCVLNVPLMLISIIGNSLVLAAVWKTPSIRSTSRIMLCTLAVSDLLVGFVVQPLYIADELTDDLLLHRVSGMIGFLCLRSFVGYNNGHNCGPVDGAPLSHEIRQFNDRAPSQIYSGNDLSDNVSLFGNLPLEEICISSGNRYFYCYLSCYLHIFLH